MTQGSGDVSIPCPFLAFISFEPPRLLVKMSFIFPFEQILTRFLNPLAYQKTASRSSLLDLDPHAIARISCK